jgi:hypothetical protein
MKTLRAQSRNDDPTSQHGFVWVYRYVYWDESSQSHQTSSRFATADVIRCGLGTIINSSGKRIPTSDLVDGAFSE